MSRGPDAATLLERALRADAASAGVAVTIGQSDMTRWASVSFTGARHTLALVALSEPALDDWVAALPDIDLPMRGHLLADLTVKQVRRAGADTHLLIEALTVEDR
ncbi:hypothetical protein AB2M62_12605 [Sphingomonas sp. MMS12-HWE2-04]|uniref:hypothetical protein n=1 Tax=Sphingomonas sp. MMS12-HWE2-04 TaxID=3234199 RepID=UPI00384FEFAE